MSRSYFQFKQFCIHHDHCAMKVGTDGVLLGAWGCVEGHRILDIGTGTGLIALMAAQRNPVAQVLGIDIDEQAVQQAKENLADSPFNKRVSCVLQDVLTFHPDATYDAILCNPPFFTEDTMPDDALRALARNNSKLPFSSLIPKVASMLSANGSFSVIIPSKLVQEIVGICLIENLYLQRRCQVRTTSKKTPRRALLTFFKEPVTKCEEQEICIMAANGTKTKEFIELTKDYYL